MIDFYTLFSSSSGNSSLITNGRTNILIDAGVSCSKINTALGEIGLSPNEIDAVLLTHEHRDHISGAGVISRKYNVPLYASEETLTETVKITGDVYDRNLRIVKPKEVFEIRDFAVCPFSIPHDAKNPMGFSIMCDNKKYTVATDIGNITETFLKSLCKSDCVLLESNHDVDMLKNGKYPYYLKKRILSNVGHLSNDNAAWVATQLAKWGTKNITLGHLSKENNTPEFAYECSFKMLTQNGASVGEDVVLKVAPPSGIHKIN